MRWLLSLWGIRRGLPAPGQLPGLLLRVVIWGALTGPLFALALTALFDPANLRFVVNPLVLLLWAPAEGVVFALCFWIACGVGNAYLRSLVPGYPASIRQAVFMVYNSLASAIAFSTAVGIIQRFPGPVHFQIPHFWRVVAVEAVLGAVFALVIGAFIKLKLEVEATQAALRERELAQSQLAEETARAQSMALQSQINPHFFFNTLNTISALIDVDPGDARRVIGRLADMFRYTLKCTHSGPVSLDQEIQFVRDYLAIEQARFRKRLQVELPEEHWRDVRLPGLVPQPLVENAVKHGVARRLEGGAVSIEVARHEGMARVSVRNSSDEPGDFREENLFRTGHALENVRARLRLFTGRAEPLRVQSDGHSVEFSFDLQVSPL